MKLQEVTEVGFYRPVEMNNVLYEYGKTSDGFQVFVWVFDEETNLYNTDGSVFDLKDMPNVEVEKQNKKYEYRMCLKEVN